MKIIHCSDLHIDSVMEGFPPEKSSIRREEIIATFERLIDYANTNDINAIIIAGDMFDKSKVSQKTVKRVVRSIENCTCDILYVVGNHDEENVFSSVNMPNNFKVFGKTWTHYLYGNVDICGAELSNNADFLYGTLSLDYSKINIVVMHGQVIGYKSNDNAETISIPNLKDKNIDYLALGHIHYYSENKLDNRGTYAYSGCFEGRGFDECGQKGFVLLETTDSGITKSFVPFAKRTLECVEIDVSYEKDWLTTEKDILDGLVKEYSKDCLLKIVLNGERSTDFEIDINHFVSQLNLHFFFAKVYDKTSVKIEQNVINDKSIKGEFIRLVTASDLNEEDKNRIINIGLNAIKGEDLI